jgi:hypothetical protein
MERSRIPDPNYLHPVFLILVKEFKYFNPPKKRQKKSFSALKNMIGFVHLRSPDPDADFLPSRIQESKRYSIPDPQHDFLKN